MPIFDPYFVAAGSTYTLPSGTPPSSYTVNHPSGLAAGDYMLLVICEFTFPNPTASLTHGTGGFSTMGEKSATLGDNTYKLTLRSKLASAADVTAGSTSFTLSSTGTNRFHAQISAFRDQGGTTGTPAFVSHPGSGDGPSITTANDALVVFVTMRRANVALPAATSPTLTNRVLIPQAEPAISLRGVVRDTGTVQGAGTYTLNYAAADSTDVRISGVFALTQSGTPPTALGSGIFIDGAVHMAG